MRVLWLCNMVPGAVQERLGGSGGRGLWMDHVLSDLRLEKDVKLTLLCHGAKVESGRLEDGTDFEIFQEGIPYHYLPALEERFGEILRSFCPDVIHIWGTEFGHTLAMVNAAETAGMQERVIVSIQGLCGPSARHYTEGIPERVINAFSLRDLLRMDNIRMQQKKFVRRGKLERQALEKTRHVLGRTDWDRTHTAQLSPNATYHFCNETLREPFYEGQWHYASCKKHRIFSSSWLYPIKGFHYLLEAFSIVRKRYPDAVISVTGSGLFPESFSDWLREETYSKYLRSLCREPGMQEHLEFLGGLDANQMKAAYLDSNVFVLPSTIENSPNSLGEAMLLGVPCVAAEVGGVTNLMHPGEGFTYPSGDPYMLAQGIMEVFAMEDRAEAMGAKARAHALRTHDPKTNLEALLSAYGQVAAQKEGRKQ